MDKTYGKLIISGAFLLGLPCAVFAAKPVDLGHQPASILQSLAKGAVKLEEVSRSVDFKQTLHVRIKQSYLGYPVWGGDGIVHVLQGGNTTKSLIDLIPTADKNRVSLDGMLYQNLDTDLNKTPAYVFGQAQAQKALQQAIDIYQRKDGVGSTIKDKQSRLIVYIDKHNKAHWAFRVSFYVEPTKVNTGPAKPTYLMDAISFKIYQEWNDIQTVRDDTPGGGWGGNVKMGKLVYDSLTGDLAELAVQRDEATRTCYLKNADVTVKDMSDDYKVMTFACETPNANHNNVYWDGQFDAVNDGYSPGNDALFGGMVIKGMYQDWYDVPVLIENGKPMMLSMVVHYRNYDNAYWDGKQMTFGDGYSIFYPLTSLGVAAHEISHGFTQQHSDLVYSGQSGGMNEAFSDMAAQGAEWYAYGHNSWQIGPEIFKQKDRALRYMDQPSKDCEGRKPGNWCSIDEISQYRDGLDVHFSSGIYNRAYYLMGTADGWDTQKAFDVMVQANMYYWTPNTTFASGACGVMKATQDYGYDPETVVTAFKTVGIDVSTC